jgi:hypothetical protein
MSRLGHLRRFERAPAIFRFSPTPDVSLRRNEPTFRARAEALDVHSSSNGDSASSSYDLFQLKSQSFETSNHQCIGPFQRLVSKRHIGIPPDHLGQRQLDLQPG